MEWISYRCLRTSSHLLLFKQTVIINQTRSKLHFVLTSWLDRRPRDADDAETPVLRLCHQKSVELSWTVQAFSALML